jgi:hypothetical protein
MSRRRRGRRAVLAAGRLLGLAVAGAAGAALMVAAAPVSLVAAAAVTTAWAAGWPPRRLGQAALWCLPMVAVWVAATAAATQSWWQAAAAPYLAWLAMWQLAAAGSVLRAAVTIAPVAVPLGLLVGALAWSRRILAMQAGTGGLTPRAPAAFDRRQWRHQVRSARARTAAPGAVPLLSRNGAIVAGAVIRAVGHAPSPLAAIPYQRLRSHQVVIGTTGTGNSICALPFTNLRACRSINSIAAKLSLARQHDPPVRPKRGPFICLGALQGAVVLDDDGWCRRALS